MNRPCIQRTVFENYGIGDKSFGFRFYDDHEQTYNNTMQEADLKLLDEDFLRRAQQHFDKVALDLFDFCLEHGLYVDDNWYHFKLDDQDGWGLVPADDPQ